MSRVVADYMVWAKTHHHPRWDVTGSNLLPCSIDELPGAREALDLTGDADNGYRPLVEAIATRYGVAPERVATAGGTSGANFLLFAAMLEVGDEVLVERPGYDPLLAAPRLLGARITRFDRPFEEGFGIDADRVRAALTPRTRLVVISNAHNPSGAVASKDDLVALGRLAESAGVHVLVDEVYLDAVAGEASRPAAARGPQFITTSSLTKAYGLPGLRCGWVIATPQIAERVRRMRDIVEAIGAHPSERLSVLAFGQLGQLADRARRILAPNGAAMRRFLASHPRVRCVVPENGMIVFPRLTGVDDTGPLVERLLREFEVGVVPGRFFEAPAHFRIALGGRHEVLEGALAQLSRALADIDP